MEGLLLGWLACLVVLASSSVVPHPRDPPDSPLPRTPPGFDLKVLGSLSRDGVSDAVPVIVFLHALREENSEERLAWFRELADRGEATLVLPLAAKRYVESHQVRERERTRVLGRLIADWSRPSCVCARGTTSRAPCERPAI